MRILDVTERRGPYATKMLADMGADVIKVEAPEGSPERQLGPYKNDIPGLENSLYFVNFNTNKKGITLNLETSQGRDIFRRLAERADVVVEDGDIGRMSSLGLGYPELKGLNRRLIMASVTAFGQSGPYSSYASSDIVSFAMGGLMYINGPTDAAPVVAPCEQSNHSASVATVFAIVSALFLRMRNGEGQLIDASAHEVTATMTGGIMQYGGGSTIARRAGSQFGAVPGRIYPCKDGYIHVLTIRPNHWQGFVEVLGSPEAIAGKEWLDGGRRNANVDLIDGYVTEFTMRHGKMEITEACQAHGVPCTPVNTTADFYQDPHMRERGFFDNVDHPAIGRHEYFRPPYSLSETPCVIRRPAPLLGQHNREIYVEELGFGLEEVESLRNQQII